MTIHFIKSFHYILFTGSTRILQCNLHSERQYRSTFDTGNATWPVYLLSKSSTLVNFTKGATFYLISMNCYSKFKKLLNSRFAISCIINMDIHPKEDFVENSFFPLLKSEIPEKKPL